MQKDKASCTHSAVPLVFDSDLAELKSIGKATDKSLHNRNVNGNIIKAINKKKNSTKCIFWDEHNPKCSIWAEKYLDALEHDRVFAEVMRKIEIFSGNTSLILPNESQKTPYVTLRKVNY